MSTGRSRFLGTAFRAAILAGNHIVRNLGRISRNDISTKSASDFVTRIDRESENLIIRTISRSYPDHHFLAEESAGDPGSGAYRWIIDPLDGTTNFIHSYPFFSVSIALEKDGEIVLGVVYDPMRDELFTAEKDRGAFLNGKKIKVSLIENAKDSLVMTGFPFRKKKILDEYLHLFKNVFMKVSDIRRDGSAALNLSHIACGRSDAFFEIGLSIWDMAAGSLMIKEAGGIATDFGGGNDYLHTGNIVAGNPAIHKKILKEAKSVFSGIIDR